METDLPHDFKMKCAAEALATKEHKTAQEIEQEIRRRKRTEWDVLSDSAVKARLATERKLRILPREDLQIISRAMQITVANQRYDPKTVSALKHFCKILTQQLGANRKDGEALCWFTKWPLEDVFTKDRRPE